ncbi:MAG: helix-turn-helix transcriptional regulator [Clostridia bacterium]|nr:helix-turn-helix transcriptional regulator [Clostridia bacterium]
MKQFYINLESFINNTINFTSYERAHYNGDWKSYEHMHAFAEIFFITQGKGVFRTKAEDVPIHKGMVIIVNPMTVHTEISSEDSPLEYAVFSVKNTTFVGQSTERSKQVFVYNLFSDYDFLFNIIRVLEDEEEQKRPLWQMAVITELNKFAIFVLRKTGLYSLNSDSKEKPNTMSVIHLFLKSQYQEEISLDKLANYFFLNKYYLAHAYKKKYGISVMKQLNIFRCNEAKKLLETTNLPISEIAVSVGFNSISHFSGTYKSIINESPAKTRKSFYENTKK